MRPRVLARVASPGLRRRSHPASLSLNSSCTQRARRDRGPQLCADLRERGASLTKIVTVVDGVVCSTREPNWPSRFRFSCYRVTSPDDLYGVLSQAAALDPAPCVLRAEPRAETGRRAIYDSDNGPAGMFTVPRAWVGFDFEKVPYPKRKIAFEGG